AQLDPKKIPSRFGLPPHCSQSGSSIRGKTCSRRHGAAELRATMTMAARSASTHCDRIKNYKQRKLDEGKNRPVVRNNLIYKIIEVICDGAGRENGRSDDALEYTFSCDREEKAA